VAAGGRPAGRALPRARNIARARAAERDFTAPTVTNEYLWLVFSVESGEPKFYGLFSSKHAADELAGKIVGAQVARVQVIERGYAEKLLPMIA